MGFTLGVHFWLVGLVENRRIPQVCIGFRSPLPPTHMLSGNPHFPGEPPGRAFEAKRGRHAPEAARGAPFSACSGPDRGRIKTSLRPPIHLLGPLEKMRNIGFQY